MIKDYLTDLEISKIEAFCANTEMFEAVHKVVLANVYYTASLIKGKPLEARNQAFDVIATAYKNGDEISNEKLGEGLRGLFEGVDRVEQGFALLKTIKEDKEPVETPYNEAI